MAQLRIIDEYEAVSTNPKRLGQKDVVLVYMVDTRGPHYAYYPKEGFSFDRAFQELQNMERDRRMHVGRTAQV